MYGEQREFGFRVQRSHKCRAFETVAPDDACVRYLKRVRQRVTETFSATLVPVGVYMRKPFAVLPA